MQLVNDEVDGNYYIDIVLSPAELKRIKQNEMLSAETIIKRRKYYLGIRLQGLWDYSYDEEDDERQEEDQEGF